MRCVSAYYTYCAWCTLHAHQVDASGLEEENVGKNHNMLFISMTTKERTVVGIGEECLPCDTTDIIYKTERPCQKQ